MELTKRTLPDFSLSARKESNKLESKIGVDNTKSNYFSAACSKKDLYIPKGFEKVKASFFTSHRPFETYCNSAIDKSVPERYCVHFLDNDEIKYLSGPTLLGGMPPERRPFGSDFAAYACVAACFGTVFAFWYFVCTSHPKLCPIIDFRGSK